MALPFFYIDQYDISQKEITLYEDTSRHIVQVLRMKRGDRLNLTDGNGYLLDCTITDDNKKHCQVIVNGSQFTPCNPRKISIAISLLKNSSRFEWFLEKATELGISEIIPLLCARTERQKFRADRMKNILVSAMLQSQQVWLPLLHEPIAYELLFRQEEIVSFPGKLIAHCLESEKKKITDLQNGTVDSQIILIGPEGDFTPEEIEMALQKHFVPITLGNTRLRTETAGVTAAVLLQAI
jgi:16S rRNA (uracil1498-N3)-methyltransferase